MSGITIPNGGTIGSVGDTDAISISSSGAVTLSSDFVPATPLSHRNFVYNGDFKIWQRSDSTSSVNITNGGFQADRWKAIHDVSPEGLEFARSTDVPSGYGFANSLKITCDSADTSVSASHAVTLVQEFESQDLVPWRYGTANAKNLMLSFWVKTNLTGSHSIGLIKHDNTRYGIPINYTVSSADTWEKKEILISPTAGSTSLITASGGAIDNDNGHGASLIWNLASGSNYQSTNNTWTTSIDKRIMGTSSDQNFVGSTSNNFYITGVQLELGSVATPFEHRSYADELARCQRYYYKPENTVNAYLGKGHMYASGTVRLFIPHPVTMRTASVTLEQDYGNQHFYAMESASLVGYMHTNWSIALNGESATCIGGGTADGHYTAGNGVDIKISESTAYLALKAEL
jgi:hypothetical protein